MKTNQAGIDIIKEFEGCKLKAYRDIRGIWTIGYGHTRTAKPGMVITEERALELLAEDLRETEEYITRALGNAPTTENQFAAKVCLAYNIGIGNYGKSSVLREHKAGNHTAAAKAFHLWDKSTIDGQLTPVAGLARRRQAESKLYQTT